MLNVKQKNFKEESLQVDFQQPMCLAAGIAPNEGMLAPPQGEAHLFVSVSDEEDMALYNHSII